jgi:hypothetical protein
MSDGLSAILPDWFARVGHRFLGERAAPAVVTLRHDQSAILVSLAFEGGVRLVAVKRLNGSRMIVCPAELSRIHESARVFSSLLAASTPLFLAHSLEHNFVVMEYVEGPTLLRVLLERGGRAVAGDRSALGLLIRSAGELLAEFHRVTPEVAGATAEPRANGSYVEDWIGLWESLGVDRKLPAGLRDSRRLLDRLSPEFFGRAVARLHPVDMQPKNILVPPPGRLCLIDPDYSWANPALGVGQFLASLDRVRLRSRWPGMEESVRSWKRAFLAGYTAGRPDAVSEDVLFYYTWALLRMQQQHESRHPWMRLLLRRFYSDRLARFLAHLKRSTPSGTLPAASVSADLLAC